MIIINNIPVMEEKYTKEKVILPIMTEEEKAEKMISGISYSFNIPSCFDKSDEFYESLLDKHLDYKKNPNYKGKEATAILYRFMHYDWFFSSVEDTFEKDGALRYILRFQDEKTNNIILIETDVIEYGYIVALEIMDIINGDRNV